MARRKKSDAVPTIEWITGVIGLAIVLWTLGFVGYEAFRGGTDAPLLETEVERTDAAPGGFRATVAVRNQGRRAAADVMVEGVVRSRSGAHRSQFRIDYVPGLSARRGTLVFPGPPDAAGVEVRILGYTTP